MCGLILLAQGLAVSQAGAQVLVYRIEYRKETGINYHPFEAVILPRRCSAAPELSC